MATVTTGLLGNGLRGKIGGAVFEQRATGTVVRDLVIPHDPQTPEQRAFRQRQAVAARAWSELEPEAVAAWTVYAKTVNLRPMNAFTTLYGRLLRLDPAAPVPLAPPALPFFGDLVTVFAEGIPAGVYFGRSSPNAEGIVTELLVQPLASRNRRTYREKYRHGAFTTWEGALSVTVPCAPGWVACAYRFVNSVTGQVTAMAELGVVRV